MALDSNGLELLNRQPEAHVSVDNMVSILYYSPAVVQPRKPFVQEISRKKDRTVFQCPPYIFPYILSPYVMHVLYPYRSAVRRSTVPVHGTS